MGDRNLVHYIWILLKGMAMGAADVVPGVSGGTIAFISGIYEELILSINAIGPGLLKIFREEGLRGCWKAVNGNFLLALFCGIGISVISLSKGISWLLENEPVLLWAFFFGLVLASIFYVGKAISQWRAVVLFTLAVGAVLAFLVVSLPVSEQNESLPYLFLSGALAVCAMILPGISGAFILVLLGSYKTVLDAVHERDFQLLAIVALGALFGLLSFSKLLKWMFSKFKDATLALLTGFIIGSLPKIWPWKKVLESREFDGKTIAVREENVWPWNYDGEPQLYWALALAALGFCLIFILEHFASKKDS